MAAPGRTQGHQERSGQGAGPTRGVYGAPGPDGSPAAIEPIVGWLVCVDGENFGRDYRLYAGVNHIGRADSNRVQISGDNQISRERHACVIFDARKTGKFFIAHETGICPTFLNEEIVTKTTELLPYSKIETGSTTLIFVPFCQPDRFMWELG